MIFNLPLGQIDAAQLERLKTQAVREGRQLDYKEILPGNSDDDKREFLSDVASFANAAGGDLIFGIQERREDRNSTGEIGTIVGLPGVNLDTESLRLQAIIRDGIAPRLAPVAFREIRRDPDPPCLLLRVPRSWAGLHMVTYKNHSRFYSRTSAGKYQLDVHEIRAGFVAVETAFERLRRFRMERVAQVLALEAPAPIAEGPKLIFHAFPIGVDNEVWARVRANEQATIALALPPFATSPSDWRFNLDGFVGHTLHSDLSKQAYTQLFRDGGIEVVSGATLVKLSGRGGFVASGMERSVIAGFKSYQKFWQDFDVNPPLVIGLTLSGVKGWKVLRSAYGIYDRDEVLDRDLVAAPDVILSDFATPPDEVLRPLFDYVWNGGGWSGSPNYRDGRWVAPSD